MDANGVWYGLMGPSGRASQSPPRNSPRILIIGAGSRGSAYARAVTSSTSARVYAVAEPLAFRRQQLGKQYIWRDSAPLPGQEFNDWRDFVTYETSRRKREAAGEKGVEVGVHAVFVCTLDEQHADIVVALAPLGLHVLCEKPLATTLDDCLRIYAALAPAGTGASNSADTPNPDARRRKGNQIHAQRSIFSIGHVLRYSPHNTLLRDILLRDRAIGSILSLSHTEPVGYWHFSHSYVRGNWRTARTTAPSLLTKSCHDIDLLLWLLSAPADPSSAQPPHLPTTVSSTGRLNAFRRVHKPRAAGAATNCLRCPAEPDCLYSARKIYLERHLRRGVTGWPVSVVVPDIEDVLKSAGPAAAEARLLDALGEDYDADTTPAHVIAARNWFGRCVWEADNDVCDDQVVTLNWEDEEEPGDGEGAGEQRLAKTATFHMIAHTEAQCARRGVVYGTKGEVTYDSETIKVHDFASGRTDVHRPRQMPGGHGGGDDGLVLQFIGAVEAVMNAEMEVEAAQRAFVGCTLEDVLRSHALVFAAEEARTKGIVVDWGEWWGREVEARLGAAKRAAANMATDEGDREWELVNSRPA